MGRYIGTTVRFQSPTEHAVLEGTVVRQAPAEDFFDDFHTNPVYGWDAEEEFVSIRVTDIIERDKETYTMPTVCRVPTLRITDVVDEDNTTRAFDQT